MYLKIFYEWHSEWMRRRNERTWKKGEGQKTGKRGKGDRERREGAKKEKELMTTWISKLVSGGQRVISSFRPPSPRDYTSPIKCHYCEDTCSLEPPRALDLISLWSTGSCQGPDARGCFWPGWPPRVSTRWKVPCALTNLRTHDGPNIFFSILC